MQTSPALISVIIPTHNRHTLLQRAVKSVLSQTYPYFEIIIIDNVSDPPVETLQLLNDGRISIHRTTRFSTAPKNRNIGINRSRGQFICFLDDDDYYFPQKLEFQAAYLKQNKQVDLVYSDIRQVDKRGREICLQGGPFSREHMFLYRFININGCLIRREVLKDLKFNGKMTTFEDQYLFFQISMTHNISYLPGLVGVWNRDQRRDQLSRRDLRRSYANWKRLCQDFEYEILKYKSVRRFYFGKMSVLALLNEDFAFCGKSLKNCL